VAAIRGSSSHPAIEFATTASKSMINAKNCIHWRDGALPQRVQMGRCGRIDKPQYSQYKEDLTFPR
jgi:hypothetical protein